MNNKKLGCNINQKKKACGAMTPNEKRFFFSLQNTEKIICDFEESYCKFGAHITKFTVVKKDSRTEWNEKKEISSRNVLILLSQSAFTV